MQTRVAPRASRNREAQDRLRGGVVQCAHLLDDKIGVMRFIDSDGMMRDEAGIHVAFGKGIIDFNSDRHFEHWCHGWDVYGTERSEFHH